MSRPSSCRVTCLRLAANIGAAIALSLVLGATPAAADVVRGQQLHNAFCRSCHNPLGEGGDAIAAGAANPAAIRAALSSVAAMRLLAGFLDDGEIADIAEYLGVLYGVTPPAARVTVVEYYHAGLDHYFITAIPGEIAALDEATVIRGWARTGLSFDAYATLTGAPAGASPVCRFYLPPADGDSHFYSAFPAECEEGRVRFPQFVFESPQVMVSVLPDLASGACPAGFLQVFRLWNQRPDNNHRFTTDRTVRAAMIGQGFLAEGFGPEGVAFCAPAA
jgi:hypothetical protein